MVMKARSFMQLVLQNEQAHKMTKERADRAAGKDEQAAQVNNQIKMK